MHSRLQSMSTAKARDVVFVVDRTRSNSGERGYMVQFNSVVGPDFVAEGCAATICPLEVFDFYEHELEQRHRRFADLLDYTKRIEKYLEDEHTNSDQLRAINLQLASRASAPAPHDGEAIADMPESPNSPVNTETNVEGGKVVVVLTTLEEQNDHQDNQDAAHVQQTPSSRNGEAMYGQSVSMPLAPLDGLARQLKNLAKDAATCDTVEQLNRKVANDVKKCALLKKLRMRFSFASPISETARRLLAIVHVRNTKYYSRRARIFQMLTGCSGNWWKAHSALIMQVCIGVQERQRRKNEQQLRMTAQLK